MMKAKTKIIAELGNSHEGSLGIALSMVDMAADAGADLVKFQFHISEYESSRFEPFRVQVFNQDNSRTDYWDRVGFTVEQWQVIFKHCQERKIEFFCSPFSIEAAKVLSDTNLVQRWKLGSGEVTNFPLVKYLFETNKEVLISTGLSRLSDLEKLVSFISNNFDLSQLILMHCVSSYPTDLKLTNLQIINELKSSFGVRVGHSDHSGKLSTLMYALTFPIEYLEVHLTPHKKFFGPDVTSSITPEELRNLVEFNNDLSIMKQSNNTRDELFELCKDTAKIFRKGLYWAESIMNGSVITQNQIIIRKPWGDLDASLITTIIGKKVIKNVTAGEPVQENEIEPWRV